LPFYTKFILATFLVIRFGNLKHLDRVSIILDVILFVIFKMHEAFSGKNALVENNDLNYYFPYIHLSSRRPKAPE
jgi:hypothetical protein